MQKEIQQEKLGNFGHFTDQWLRENFFNGTDPENTTLETSHRKGKKHSKLKASISSDGLLILTKELLSNGIHVKTQRFLVID